jgi:hypothetical protein
MCLETLRNKQGYMTVCEYRNMFTQLSRYAPEEVDNDAKRQKRFIKGLNDGLQLQLLTTMYADFHTLVDKAIVIENKRHEMEEKRRRMKSQSIDNDTNPCYTTAPEFQKWYQESTSQWDVDPQELQ